MAADGRLLDTAPGDLISFRWLEPGPEIVGPNVVNYSGSGAPDGNGRVRRVRAGT